MDQTGERAGPAALLALPDYRRLWITGGLSNAMRWLETLAAALFTLDATGSALAVALVTAARSAPMLLLGAVTGVIADSWDRRRLLLAALYLAAASATVLALCAVAGVLAPWMVALGAFLGGLTTAAEMSTRRRMVAEIAGPGRITPAIALDTVTNSVTRMLGPLAGGTLYGLIGIGGSYAVSASLYGVATLLTFAVKLRQPVRRLRLSRVPADLAEGVAAARTKPALMMVLAVTVVMNMFGFSYSALVAPLGRALWDLSPEAIGLLASAEAMGAFIGGLILTRAGGNLPHRVVFLSGSVGFFAMLLGFTAAPWFLLGALLLALGGLGTAAFGNMQTTLVLIEAPPEARSRVLGLVTACIGMGPVGVLVAGALAQQIGALAAVVAMALAGLLLLGLAAVWLQAPARPR